MFRVIAIDSEYCSMGRWISIIAGSSLNLRLYEEYDLCQEAGVDYDAYKAFEKELPGRTVEELKQDPQFLQYSEAFSAAVRRLAEKGNCVIHDKAATYLLKDHPDVLRIMFYNANMERKIPRCRADKSYNNENLNHDEAIAFIENEDRKRSLYYEAVTGEKWGVRNNYHMLLDSDVLSREKCAEVLIEACTDVKITPEEAAELISKSLRWSAGVDVSKMG